MLIGALGVALRRGAGHVVPSPSHPSRIELFELCLFLDFSLGTGRRIFLWHPYKFLLGIQDLVQIARLTAGHTFGGCRIKKAGILFQSAQDLLLLSTRQLRVNDNLMVPFTAGLIAFDLVHDHLPLQMPT
jgi:hypothetical protein